MWVGKLHYETLFENLTNARAQTAELHARIAAMQATQDWLTMHVNRLEHERGLLTQARLGLLFPVPEIQRQAPGILGVPGDEEPPTHALPHDAIPLAQMMSASMEDLGDEAAAAMGIRHDAQGLVHYR